MNVSVYIRYNKTGKAKPLYANTYPHMNIGTHACTCTWTANTVLITKFRISVFPREKDIDCDLKRTHRIFKVTVHVLLFKLKIVLLSTGVICIWYGLMLFIGCVGYTDVYWCFQVRTRLELSYIFGKLSIFLLCSNTFVTT